MKMKKGEEIILSVESMAFEGKGIARIDGLVIFVSGAVPGDTVRAEITHVKKSYLEAKTLAVVEPSSSRVHPRCRYVGSCGGCKMQHVEYAAQLDFKHRHVIEAFERIGRIEGLAVPAPIGAEHIYFYRNKMEFSFSDQRWLTQDEIATGERIPRTFALGLHVPGRFDKVIDIEECFLQSGVSNRILASLRSYALEKGIPPYSTKTHEGFLRFVVIRQSHATGEIMVNVVTADHRPDIVQPLSMQLRKDVPEVSTVVNNINRRKAQIARGEEEVVYIGEGYITDAIGPYRFRISANSFFQTNTAQAERLYETAKSMGELTADDTVLDLYCGTGTIALFLSDVVKEVIGIENIPDAVRDARENAAMNGVENVRFIEEDVLEWLKKAEAQQFYSPTVVYLDPPRSGVHPKALRHIADMRAPKIVYVSCNPATQARDIAAFIEHGYRIDAMQPVDMFPHTYHIENVARLTLHRSENPKSR